MYSLHPITTELVGEFLASAATGTDGDPALARARQGMAWMRAGDSRGADAVTHSLATFLAGREPAFEAPDVSLSTWEASIDRGLGMLLRPPSRIFVDAGFPRLDAHQFPIRLDAQRGMMAGAYVPAHLIADARTLLDERLERLMKRLKDAELDPVLAMGTMIQAFDFAAARGTGLLEAMDVLHDQMPATRVVRVRDRKALEPALRTRLEAAARPPRKPGLWQRLGRSGQ